MKTKNLILMVLGAALWLAPEPTHAQQRRVDWIHGLGGNQGSWQNVNNNYNPPQRQIIGGNRAGYGTGNGIPNFATQVQGNTGGANTISISHSLGGAAVRQVDIWNQNHWSGNMTVGSPLRGAQIAVSTQNGVAQQFINQGITELLRGPAIGSTALFIISSTIGVLLAVTGALGSMYSNTIAGILVNAITGSLNLTPVTINDLNPNGAYMQNIAAQTTNTPKIQIWGREDNPILWRTAGSFAEQTDQWGVNLANDVIGVYNTAANVEYVASWTPPFLLFHGYWTWRGDQWKAGANWLQNTSNWGWQAVIGAGYVQQEWVYVPVYPPDCDHDQCLQWMWVQLDVFTYDQSDGVVPAFSARNDGGAWRGHIVEAPGINHSEMLRFNDISPTLTGVFTGNTGGQQIFTIGQ